jgi:site-specific recombinase XerD
LAGIIMMRSGKGDTSREVPLNTHVGEALINRLKDRSTRFPELFEPALFLSLKGKRLSCRAIGLVLRQLETDAHLELSAHVLRYTCLTNLIRRGNDLVLVAEVAGQKRLETTRRSSLPSLEDRERAMEGLHVDD